MTLRSGEAHRDWLSAREIAELGLPNTKKSKAGVLMAAKSLGWVTARDDAGRPLCRSREGRGGVRLEFHVSLLPEEARRKLAALAVDAPCSEPDAADPWQLWDYVSERGRAEAQRRLEILQRVEALVARGAHTKSQAIAAVVAELAEAAKPGGEKSRISTSTIWGWFKLVAGVSLDKRLAYLAPAHQGRTAVADIPPEAWELYKADYLRPSKPTHAAVYRALKRVAADKGWILPSPKTLQRRLDAEVAQDVQLLSRGGTVALKRAQPHLDRDYASLRPMQVGNLDGHTWDNMVRWPDGEVGRPVCVAVQDIASRKITSIRFGRTLSQHLVRLALADTFAQFGTFERLIMDNGRENAAKAISGGQKRLRWAAIDPDAEVPGMLKLLGVQAVFAQPHWGQAKPIERAFRDFAHEISKSAAFEGSYVGHNPLSKPSNYGARVIPVEEFEAIVRRKVDEHNARPGRRGAGLDGRSFDEVFAEGLSGQPLRRLNPEQLRLCTLTARQVSMHRSDHAVRIEDHRYWAPQLGAIRPQKVIVRFNPEALDEPVYVYALQGRLICEAPRVGVGTFDNARDAHEHNRKRRERMKKVAELKKTLVNLTPADVAAIQAGARVAAPPIIVADEKVIVGNFGAPRTPEQLGGAPPDPSDHDANWQRGFYASLPGGS